ncbi:MAG: bifunctional metallophosphatase/5'-nucleotidase, partial [Bacteroidaceae bacterium]|nr:bifunctional metallophosphatase/5'-nucleotidase [Bacteroidaceae bacterium]
LLLLDCGDFSQGSAYYNLFKGEVEVKLMNQMAYDACTIGNHEFDFGLENMARLFRMAKFPIVCCNYDFTGTPVEGLVKPYIIKERAGVRVGIIGVAPQLEGLVSKSSYGQTRYTPPIKAAQPVVDFLREKEHCDVVICLSHLGWGDKAEEDRGFIAGTTGIDVVLGGHSHTYFEHAAYLKNKEGHEVVVEHMGKNARFLGTLELSIEK